MRLSYLEFKFGVICLLFWRFIVCSSKIIFEKRKWKPYLLKILSMIYFKCISSFLNLVQRMSKLGKYNSKECVVYNLYCERSSVRASVVSLQRLLRKSLLVRLYTVVKDRVITDRLIIRMTCPTRVAYCSVYVSKHNRNQSQLVVGFIQCRV